MTDQAPAEVSTSALGPDRAADGELAEEWIASDMETLRRQLRGGSDV
ncbi:hypothetical protein [Streptomyces pseudoechinosporeus]